MQDRDKPGHLSDEKARLRRALRAKQRQLGGKYDVLVWEAAYEQWHRLLFAQYLAENNLLLHPEFDAPVTLAECEELAEGLGEPDGWSVAARFASEILPGIFRLNDPCVQLRLAPEHRIALERIVAGLPTEVFLADDSLGWVYQYWQSERKAQVNASEKKIGGADLGPVTQLFTENYMVRFLLENSLGAWWAARHPDSPLVSEFQYLRRDNAGKLAAGTFNEWPDTVARLTVLDPCCGSGHFLVEAFRMLWRMRVEEEDLGTVEAQDAVLRDNLFGLELDPRCVQIAMFAVALAAWRVEGEWRELPTPHIACSGIPARAPLEEWTALAKGDLQLEAALRRLHSLFTHADTLGSLIDPRRVVEFGSTTNPQTSFEDIDFGAVAPLLEAASLHETADPAAAVLGADAFGIAKAAILLSRRYSLVATNVPYLGRGRQSARLATYLEAEFPLSSADLATVFLERFLRSWSAVCAVVVPQNWLFLASYENFRRWVIGEASLPFAARLGAGAFGEISGEIVKAALVVAASPPFVGTQLAILDVSEAASPLAKAERLKSAPPTLMAPSRVLSLAGAVVPLGSLPNAPPLESRCQVFEGTKPGQTARVTRYFWEVPLEAGFWKRLQTSPTGESYYSGFSKVIARPDWLADNIPQSNTSGSAARRRAGVLIAKIGNLPASLYMGHIFDNNTFAILPSSAGDLLALWVFCEDGELARLARLLNQKLDVSQGAVSAVPFDIEYWREVAAERYPNGLPNPQSTNPAEWLFSGYPTESTQALQAAVIRLVGYRWPEQSESDNLDELIYGDGIVCLQAVAGELPAADRLQALLARAYGEKWSPSLIRQLLECAGSKKKNLTDWLKDDFFKHHCKLFSNRPFVWHIWDGHRDGFSALANYHRLDRSGLEKLTYTYLGEWTERQRADAEEEVAGADVRLAAALDLKQELQAILAGEPPYDIYVRWKELDEQPIGWEPDLDDGVRLNVRPFVEAGVLRSKFTVHWRKDRGKNPDGSVPRNDIHLLRREKLEARRKGL